MKQKPDVFFVFDVESIGLHGQAYAVAGGIYDHHGVALLEFEISCPPEKAEGADSDRAWVAENCPPLHPNCGTPKEVRDMFWAYWQESKTKHPQIITAVECGWPVEAGFLSACIADAPEERRFAGPYPLHEIATYMCAAGMDPMATYERTADELPKHSPLHDARQSARLLTEAMMSIDDHHKI